MSLLIGITSYVAFGCVAATLLGQCIYWASGPHDEKSEARDQARSLLAQHRLLRRRARYRLRRSSLIETKPCPTE